MGLYPNIGQVLILPNARVQAHSINLRGVVYMVKNKKETVKGKKKLNAPEPVTVVVTYRPVVVQRNRGKLYLMWVVGLITGYLLSRIKFPSL